MFMKYKSILTISIIGLLYHIFASPAAGQSLNLRLSSSQLDYPLKDDVYMEWSETPGADEKGYFSPKLKMLNTSEGILKAEWTVTPSGLRKLRLTRKGTEKKILHSPPRDFTDFKLGLSGEIYLLESSYEDRNAERISDRLKTVLHRYNYKSNTLETLDEISFAYNRVSMHPYQDKLFALVLIDQNQEKNQFDLLLKIYGEYQIESHSIRINGSRLSVFDGIRYLPQYRQIWYMGEEIRSLTVELEPERPMDVSWSYRTLEYVTLDENFVPEGGPHKIADNLLFFRLSPNGERLVFERFEGVENKKGAFESQSLNILRTKDLHTSQLLRWDIFESELHNPHLGGMNYDGSRLFLKSRKDPSRFFLESAGEEGFWSINLQN